MKYKNALESTEKKKIERPIHYLKNKLLRLLKSEEEVLKKRNAHIVKKMKNLDGNTVALVIGQRHLKGLNKMFKKEGIKVIVPEILKDTLPQENFSEQLKKILTAK